ncbi:MAG: hypothetical protein II842_02930 [Butyrivibrio sp.]|nr:hypothetical protein [Butyrivibrio sp.]
MKKRLFALLLSGIIFGAYAVTGFAENDDRYATGTQSDAKEDVVDVDLDIRENLQSLVPEEIEEISIGTADELIELAQKCTLDTWSQNKRVVLTADISLLNKDFNGIPSFGGIFDGQGHTLSEVSITSGLSYAGLFINVQKTGVIKNLHVTGAVMPSGNTTIIGGIAGDNCGYIGHSSFKGLVKGNDYIGGIAGINELSGCITYCTSDGYIDGVHFTGGIAGKNDGNISNCQNEALVNTTNTDKEITLDAFEKLTGVINLFKDGLGTDKDVAKESVTIYDTGGIAGESIGIISRCINNGEIGYSHVGYNVGGIVGRQSGYVYRCSNNGKIKGRKDIGGIVGQAEPYVAIDMSSDIAYQLEQAVSKLHDNVTVTLKDAKNQSNVISSRLAIIQKFTAGAVTDARYISDGLIDFANGVAGSATEAFSRIDYIMEETSKNGGAIDKIGDGMEDIGKSTKDITRVAGDTDIEKYIKDDDERRQYKESKTILESAAAQYSELRNRSKRVYSNLAIEKKRGDYTTTTTLDYYFNDGTVETNYAAWGEADIGTGLRSDAPGSWKYPDGTVFPQSDSSDDQKLLAASNTEASLKEIQYAANNYVNPITGVKGKYEEDISTSTATILGIYEKHLPEMSEEVRKDAQSAMNNLDQATQDFASSAKQTKGIIGNVAGESDITFPQFSSDYKAHSVSLADNMQGMNDNFGLLNGEVNNATGILIDDLLDISDQFNEVLNLYTDAIDGVLDKDYTSIYTDQSYEAVTYTTDATIDTCFNYGECEGDISVSGIAGTMAIDFEFDKEGAITSIKENSLNTSYITRCVLRDNRNYGDVTSLKNYTGGVCGLQEMGTIYDCGSYAKVKSTSGDYVGGVAGSSLAHVVRSYGKGELDGNNYIGGIVGDGKNIQECLSIVTVGNAINWYGAIAGHVDDEGKVRDNFFVSDELAGIDRVSYSLKAEPVSYDNVLDNKVFKELEEETEEKEAKESKGSKKEKNENKVVKLSTGKGNADEGIEDDGINYRELPYELGMLNVNFVLEDEDLEGGRAKVGHLIKNYGESVVVAEYPRVEEKKGFYVTWNTDGIERLTNDVTITAKYNRYRTTIAEESDKEGFYQSELLVDGLFKEGEKLIVQKTVNLSDRDLDDNNQEAYEVLEVKIPDDGALEHQIRFKPLNELYDITDIVPWISTKEYQLFLVEGNNKTLLKSTGKMGGYQTYNIEGNDFVLSLVIKHYINPRYILIGIIIAVLLVIIIISVTIGITIKRHGGKLPGFFKGVKVKVSEKIESKEQIFYDDSEDDLFKKEILGFMDMVKKEENAKEDTQEDAEDNSGEDNTDNSKDDPE